MHKQNGTAGNSSLLEKARLGVSGGSPDMSKGSEYLCGHGGLQLQKACAWPPGWRNFLPKMKQKNHARQTANTMVGR